MHKKILNCFTNHEKLLLNYLMIILQLHLKLKAKVKCGKGLKILSRKQMLQRLPLALAEVKAGNTSENLLNEVRQIVEKKKLLKKYTTI